MKIKKNKSIFEDSDILFKSITPEIIHIIMSDRKKLAKAMCRIQEYYESPHDNIRGKIFTLGKLKAMGDRDTPGVFTYIGGRTFGTKWSGYNWPSYVLSPFIKGLFDPLTDYEQDIVDTLKSKIGKFYVIGTYGEDDPEDAIDHEICHALYYLNQKYKKEVDKALSQHRTQINRFHKVLLEWGYHKSVLNDEAQAYISADYEWLITENEKDMLKYKVDIPKSLHNRLRKIKNKYFKQKK